MKRIQKLTKAPFLRHDGTIRSFMGDMLVVMPFLYAMPLFFYGFRVIKSLLISIIFCYGSDMLCYRVKKGKFDFSDMSALITASLIPLMLPASVESWVIMVAAVFAILVAKHPFGALGNNPFNPAAVGFCFVAISWPEKVFSFTKPGVWLNVFGKIGEDVKIVNTMADSLMNNGRPFTKAMDIFSGNHAGAMGVTCIIVLLACAGFLLYRKTINYQIPLGVVVGIAVTAFLFPRITTGRFESIWFELTSGMAIFGALFLATEPVTSPKHPYAKLIYGFLIGIGTMLFRFYGKMENCLPFALLIVNSLTPFLDKIGMDIDSYVDRGFRKEKTIKSAGGAKNA